MPLRLREPMLTRRRIGISRYCRFVLPVSPEPSCFFFAYNNSPMTPTRPPRLPPNQMPPSQPVLVLKQPSHDAASYDVNSGPNLAPMPKPDAAGPPPPGGGGACATIPAVRNAEFVSLWPAAPVSSPSLVCAPAGSAAATTALAVKRALTNTLRDSLYMQPPYIRGSGVAEEYNSRVREGINL